MASALRAASTFAARASSFRMRPISLLTRLSAAANTCLRCKARQGQRSAQKNPNAQLAPIAARNAHQPGTSLRLAVCPVWPRRTRKRRNIDAVLSLICGPFRVRLFNKVKIDSVEDLRRAVLDPPHVQRRRLEVDLFPAEVNHLGRAQPMPVG